MVICKMDTEDIKPLDLLAVNRTSIQVNKQLLISIVSSSSVIPNYIKCGWWKGDK